MSLAHRCVAKIDSFDKETKLFAEKFKSGHQKNIRTQILACVYSSC